MNSGKNKEVAIVLDDRPDLVYVKFPNGDEKWLPKRAPILKKYLLIVK